MDQELEQYQTAMELLTDNLKECNKILANLKQRSFTNSQMVSRFYRHAEVEIITAIEHLDNGFNLHKHLIEHYHLTLNSNKIWMK